MIRKDVNEYDNPDESKYDSTITMPVINEPVPRIIEDVLHKYLRKKINLQPEFQRNFVWDKKKQKELIRSLYLQIPLPMFYFSSTKRDIDEVVDGQQRLTTMFGFLRPNRINKEVRGKIIKNVKIKGDDGYVSQNHIRKKIKHNKIYCVYLPDISMNLKYDIFRTLNQGATMLKAQEIRNCIFASEMPEFNKLLKYAARKIRNITRMRLDRMMGEELALRFFVINRYGYDKDVTSTMGKFHAMKSDFTGKEIRRLKKKFNFFVNALKNIFKKDMVDCFQVLKKDNPVPKKNVWSLYFFTNKINQSLFHLLSYYIPKFSKNQLNRKNLKRMKKGYLKLLKNKRFTSVITGSGTNRTKNINTSRKIFEKVFLQKYVGDWTIKYKRNISASEKRTILKNVPYCYLCYGKIKSSRAMSKIHADHIEAFSAGKDSNICNVLLTHPKCNVGKKDMSLDDYRQTDKSIRRRKKHIKNIDDYLEALRLWNKEYKLDMYKTLRRYARNDSKT